ncbi:hypothetical protein K443DRAFT_130901 [Laccaria amethystina LaAM-08-1]|uniref:Ino eighty subunit 1 n=1 Tax=Laccaria amethystina LaAM-08-1 TaxID=1095629 RepID=A0A0C9Y2F4_9AGAR|nr:hypothetical protein K443DRAFT_130901 [Laccaria amethystina LaAM-08-1]
MAPRTNSTVSPISQSSTASTHPPYLNSVGYLSRKALPIKRNDAEPLTRDDVQFDLLSYIFSDTRAVFTTPYPSKSPKIPFGELYVSALYNSTKCSKVLKDKMLETPAFGVELAKISLLTNVGRINTTMAFFPEMKTALRTYHPVPSLQKTDGNAQDAPRIKNCLKAALLPSELKAVPPSTPEEILGKRRAGHCPPTSVVNLIFVLANHAAPLASTHFDGNLNFLDLFIPGKKFSSADRGRAFLWLLYYYLESSDGPNPFNDTYAQNHPGKAPVLRRLTESELRRENVDIPQEIEWGRMMSNQRNAFLQRLVSSIEYEKKAKAAAPHFISVTPESNQRRSRPQRQGYDVAKDDGAFLYYVPSQESPATVVPRPQPKVLHNPPPVGPLRIEERTMLQHAWHIASTTDPLLDSDEEDLDEHTRQDYSPRQALPLLSSTTPQHPRSITHATNPSINFAKLTPVRTHCEPINPNLLKQGPNGL